MEEGGEEHLVKRNYHTKGNYRQQLMRWQKKPTKGARERFESWLWDSEVLRIFADASELQQQGIFGLGVIFVGQGTTLVKSKKHYNHSMRKVNVYAEILAVDFALSNVEEVLINEFCLPSKVLIYSDWDEVDKLNDSPMITKGNSAINAVAERINEKKSLFSISNPTVELEILSMDKEEKVFNPFYKGSHNAARRVIGI